MTLLDMQPHVVSTMMGLQLLFIQVGGAGRWCCCYGIVSATYHCVCDFTKIEVYTDTLGVYVLFVQSTLGVYVLFVQSLVSIFNK